jgi:hypothetical protein
MPGLIRPASVEIGAPVRAMQTYQISSPTDRLVKTACENAGCLAWRNGWQCTVDERTDCGSGSALGACRWLPRVPCGGCQARYFRHESGRTFREQRAANGLTVFTFEPYQRCFAEHQTRRESYTVFAGDRRRRLGGLRVHVRAADWVEDFGEHQQRIQQQREKG